MFFKRKFKLCFVCNEKQNKDGLCICCFFIDDIDFDSHERDTFSKELNILLDNLKNYINQKKYGDWINEWNTCFIKNDEEFKHLRDKVVVLISSIREKLKIKNLKRKLKKEREEKIIIEKWLS